MDLQKVRRLLEGVKSGELLIEEALEQLRNLPYEDLGFAKVDIHRGLRKGFPEVVFCQGKTPEQVCDILKCLSARSDCVLATRARREVFDYVSAHIPDVVYKEDARMMVIGKPARSEEEMACDKNYVLVLTAGTADIPVAEEAAVTATVLGSRVERIYDVGVAGLHRLLDQKDKIDGANVIVVVAGMEGALASVVGGLVSRPVIAVPTSVGYGANFGGLSALLTMLNTCAVGVAVVNIDNGFGAGYLAHMINNPNERD